MGWIPQTRMTPDAEWVSHTQWRQRERAEQQLSDLLRQPKHVAGRLVRVDWVVVA